MGLHTSAFWLLFDQCQLVSVSIGAPEEQRRAAALEFSVGDDGDAISQKVSLIHVVGGQQNCSAYKYNGGKKEQNLHL